MRHPKCVSSIEDLADGKFEGIIDDTIVSKSVDKLVFVVEKSIMSYWKGENKINLIIL